MNTEEIAAEVVKQYKNTALSNYLLEVDDDISYKICTNLAVNWTFYLFEKIKGGNEAVLQLFGDDQGKCIDLTFNDVAQIICNDKVILQMVELVKVNQNN